VAQKVLMPNRTARMGEIADALEKQGIEVVIVPRSGPPGSVHVPDAQEIETYWRDADAFVFTGRDMVTREALAGAPNLKVGASSIIGTENIDVDAATELGIAIGYGATPENLLGVAEAVVFLTAALVKRLPAKWGALRSGGYRVDDPGRMVMNSTVGLIGLGNIGRAVAKRFQGWDTTLIATDPYVDPKVAESLNVKLVDFDTLLSTADVVSIMVTITDETRHLIGERELALMKPGAYIINTARGAAIDEPALIKALDGHLGGAAIDVWEQEPITPDHPLRNHPNVIATGHNIGHSEEVYASLGPAAVENILRGLRGEAPLYFRNPAVLERWQERLERLGIAPLRVTA
jgi:D-3-phosphoglycerate dehydrogenase / 2-oxoglutarate reductase